nr:restriction endonuclease subunit S [Acidipila rosea]
MLHAKAYTKDGTPVVAVKNIGDNRLVEDDIPRVDQETALRLERYRLLPGDIVFGRKGAVDRRALVKPEEEGWLQGSDCIRLRLNRNRIQPRFISFVLGSATHRAWFIQQAHGATMPSLNQEILSRLPLTIPSLSEQRAIARILGTLDDKIELNRKRNETLEAMARALFQSWFVDFDPVRAKAEGRDPGLPADIAALFPDSLEESTIGEIPTGWTVEQIGTLTEVIGGTTPSTKEPEYWAPDIHAWTTPKDLSSLQTPVLLKTERRISDSGLSQMAQDYCL